MSFATKQGSLNASNRTYVNKKTGKKVKLAIKVDKSILGGGIIRIGDTVIDGSIRKELENIKKR